MKPREKIFIRKLPDNTRRQDLVRFIQQGLRSSLFGLSFLPHDELGDCHIIQITNKSAGTVEYHGIAEIFTAQDINGVIQRLNGKKLKRRPLEVHQYFHRSPHNDRRNHLSFTDPSGDAERRDSDRRRPHLFIQKRSSLRVEGMEGFARTHG
ncbi:MAG: RNA-binding protein [Candidatus Sedimenticola sp. (ex Thyasira tokunagai)]